MTTSISTKLIFDESKAFIQRTQTNLFDLQRQIASGKRFDSFDDMVGDVNRLKSLEDTRGRIDSYISSINRVIPRLQSVDTVMAQLIDLGTELRNNIALRRTPSGSTLNIADIARNTLEQVEQLLNTKVDGQYIFGGSKSDSLPIRSNLESVANYTSSTADPFTTNANYFTGDSFQSSIRISDGREVSYGITANETAIQQLIAAAHLAIEIHTDDDNEVLYDMATDHVNDAIDNISTLRSQNGNDMSALVNARTAHETAKTSLSQLITEITDTDIVQASIDIAANETLLQATFQNFARISRLTLLQYLQ